MSIPISAFSASKPELKTLTHSSSFSWLPVQSQVQEQTLALLQKKLNEAHEKEKQKRDPRFKNSKIIVRPLVTLQKPDIPRDGLIQWHNERYRFVMDGRATPEQIVQLVGEDLLAARVLLNDKNITEQRRGLRLAMWAESRGAYALKDTQLSSLIYQGWILPHLSAANIDEYWKDLSRMVLLQNTEGIFRRNGDVVLRKNVLKELIATAPRPNPRDAARIQMAEVLKEEKQFDEAIALLEKLETKELSGTRTAWIAQMQEKKRQVISKGNQ